MMRIVLRDEDSNIVDIRECENFFRVDNSFRSCGRDAFKLAVKNNYTVEFHGDIRNVNAIGVMQTAYNNAINFAIQDELPRTFLKAWREGEWDVLKKWWPEFKLPPFAKL